MRLKRELLLDDFIFYSHFLLLQISSYKDIIYSRIASERVGLCNSSKTIDQVIAWQQHRWCPYYSDSLAHPVKNCMVVPTILLIYKMSNTNTLLEQAIVFQREVYNPSRTITSRSVMSFDNIWWHLHIIDHFHSIRVYLKIMQLAIWALDYWCSMYAFSVFTLTETIHSSKRTERDGSSEFIVSPNLHQRWEKLEVVRVQ